MSKEDQVRRMHAADRLLKHEIFVEAWDELRKTLRTVMETAKTDEATLKAKTMLGLMADLRSHWERVMADGKIAAEDIHREKVEKKSRWPWAA